MKKNRNYSLSLWQIPLFLLFVFIASVIYFVHTSLTKAIINEVTLLYENHNLIKNSMIFPNEKKRIRNEIALLDSCMNKLKKRSKSDKENIVEALYLYTDSAGLRTSKVEIGNPVLVDKYKEIPITLKGNGTYESAGKFTERIENYSESVRIQKMVMRGIDDKFLEMTIDFSVIE